MNRTKRALRGKVKYFTYKYQSIREAREWEKNKIKTKNPKYNFTSNSKGVKKMSHKGHKTKKGLSQDQKRKSIEKWEKAYRKSKRSPTSEEFLKGKINILTGLPLKIGKVTRKVVEGKKIKIPKRIAKMPISRLNNKVSQSLKTPTVAVLIILIAIILIIFGFNEVQESE